MVYAQAKASDQWAYYQAKGIKGLISKGMADVLAGHNSDLAAHYARRRFATKKTKSI